VRAGERVVLAARDESHAEAVANELGDLATAASVRDAIAAGDVVVLAIWLDQSKKLVPTIADLLPERWSSIRRIPSASTTTASPYARFPTECPPAPSSPAWSPPALST
jgi:hypothetical protein